MPDPIPLAQLGGIQYGQAKPFLARVVDNGVCENDPRVLERTNEATKWLLDSIIPVGGMSTYDVVAIGTTLLLPPELENAIEVEVRGQGLVNSQADVRQGWYDLINNSTYVDPSFAHDSPLVDEYLVADTTDPTILRRRYDFPGLTQGATVRVTGAKRFLPITSDNDYLIIQNLIALKLAIMALERQDINDIDNGQKYYQAAVAVLEKEVKKHLLDPRNSLKRRANYEKDLAQYPPNTFGWTRARLALEIPGLLTKGKSEISRVLEMAEMRLMSKGMFKGTLESFTATVTGGHVQFPARVESVLAAKVCGQPIDVRSIFFGYQQNGPSFVDDCICACSSMLLDEGEVYDETVQTTRRQYRLVANLNEERLNVVAKLRWVKKEPTDLMVIRNFESLRLMATGIMEEGKENWQGGAVGQAAAINELEKELREFIGGNQLIVHVQDIAPIGGETM